MKQCQAPSQDPRGPLLITTPTLPCGHVYVDFCDSNLCGFYSFTSSACILKQYSPALPVVKLFLKGIILDVFFCVFYSILCW